MASCMSTQAQAGGGPGTARRRAVCQGSRDGSREKINLIIAVARVPAKVNKSLVPRRWCPVGTKRKRKGRFGVGVGLRGQVPDLTSMYFHRFTRFYILTRYHTTYGPERAISRWPISSVTMMIGPSPSQTPTSIHTRVHGCVSMVFSDPKVT